MATAMVSSGGWWTGSMSAKSLQSRPTLWDPTDCSPPVSSVHRILEPRILEWVAMFSSNGTSWPEDQTCVSVSPALAGRLLTTSATWESWKQAAKNLLMHTTKDESQQEHNKWIHLEVVKTACEHIWNPYCAVLSRSVMYDSLRPNGL